MNTEITHGMWVITVCPKGRLMLAPDLLDRLGYEVVFAIAETQAGQVLTLIPSAVWNRRKKEHGERLGWWQFVGSTASSVFVGEHRRVTIPLHLRELFELRSGMAVVVRLLGETAEVLPLTTWRKQMNEWRTQGGH